MFDTLLEEFEDDVTRTSDEEEGFGKLPVAEVDDVELEDDLEAVDEEAEDKAHPDEEEFLLSAEDTESWSDDPVRMYLTQMGEIPLLDRKSVV